MSLKQTLNKVRPQVREEATEWLVAFCEQELDASGRESFDRWLRTSPEHVRAYLQVSALWQSTGLLARNTNVDIEVLVQRALSEHDVLELSTKEKPFKINSGGGTNSQRSPVFPVWRTVTICFLLVSAIAGGITWWQLTRTPTYATGAAEQRTVRLPDGSTVQLNARSRIELHFTAEERGVDLVEGQAMFSVFANPRRAFVVHSDTAQVRAVGTKFDVYRKKGGTTVTVIQGRVAVREPQALVLVSAGEQALATSRAPMHANRTNVFAATAWTEGKLVFDSTSLREVVAEFNRIGLRQLVIEDESLLELHVSGVFPATDPAQLVGFLRERFGVTVTETDEKVRLSGAARK